MNINLHKFSMDHNEDQSFYKDRKTDYINGFDNTINLIFVITKYI